MGNSAASSVEGVPRIIYLDTQLQLLSFDALWLKGKPISGKFSYS